MDSGILHTLSYLHEVHYVFIRARKSDKIEIIAHIRNNEYQFKVPVLRHYNSHSSSNEVIQKHQLEDQ